jgi:cbb3-type cytochrome oxidase subunit 3
MENSKVLALLIFFITFVGILVYVFANKKRSQRLESYKYIPLDDKDDAIESNTDHKVTKDE